MKDRRGKISLLLFLLINLTACQTWKATSTQSIIADQPDRVRVVFLEGMGQTPLELEAPSVDGDELVGVSDARMSRVPLADIAYIEVGKFDFWKTGGAGLLGSLVYTFLALLAGAAS
jgi:hypothetical protein